MQGYKETAEQLKQLIPPVVDQVAAHTEVTRVNGKESSSACPFCGGGGDDSDRFCMFDDTDSYWCRQCNHKGDSITLYQFYNNCDFKEMAKDYGLSTPPPSPSSKKKFSKKSAWNMAEETNTLLTEYFSSRGVHFNEEFPQPASLKFASWKDRDTGEQVTSILAAVTNLDDTTVEATLRTYLDPTTNKVTKRIMKGDIILHGRGVWFDRARANNEEETQLIIGEGIETVLSAMQATGINGVAGLDTGKMESVTIPDHITELFILVDEDILKEGARQGYAGQRVCLSLAKHYNDFFHGETDRAWIVTPTDNTYTDNPTKTDFNDISKEQILERFEKKQRFSEISWTPPVISKPPEESQSENDTGGRRLDKAIKRMNNRHAACLVGSSFVVIKETKDPETSSINISLLKQETFKLFYKTQKIFMNDKMVELPPLWLGHKERRTYEDLVFDPSGDAPAEYYNIFKGFNRVVPKEGDWSLFKELILDVACSGRKELFRYCMAWFQNIIRNPSKKANVALVFYGGQGCGKGTVLSWFREIFKEYYIQLTDGNQLTDKFNKQLAGKLLVFADEAMFTGDKRITNKMKALITEDTFQVTYKNVDAITMNNYMNIVVATNNDHAIDAALDERRYGAFNFSNDKAQDRKYFGAIEKQRKNGGLEALAHHLINTTDYDDIDVSLPPKNKEIEEQKSISLGPVESFWMECLTRGYILTPPKGDPEEDHKFCWINDCVKGEQVMGIIPFEWEKGLPVRMDFIYSEFIDFCRLNGIRIDKNSRSFWAKTRKRNSNPVFLNGHKVGKKRESRCFFPQELSVMKEEFSSNVVRIDWESDCVETEEDIVEPKDEFTSFDGQF